MQPLKDSLIACTMLFGMVAMPTLAAVPTDESLKELMKITKVDEMARQMMSSESTMSEQMVQSMLAGISSDEISDDKRQRLNQVITKYNNKILSDEYINSVMTLSTQGYIDAAKRHFTQKEVDAQINFYGSKVGQSIIDKQPAMMQDYIDATMPAIMKSTMAQMQKILPNMEAEIEALELND